MRWTVRQAGLAGPGGAGSSAGGGGAGAGAGSYRIKGPFMSQTGDAGGRKGVTHIPWVSNLDNTPRLRHASI